MTDWIQRSADERGVSRRHAWVAVLVPFIGLAIIVGLRFAHMGSFRFVVEEDGLIEWLQFLAFAGSGVLAAMIGVLRLRAGRRWQALIFAMAAFGLVFVAGEEIAWGQRLMSLETPEWLREINLQEEVTLHNIVGVLFWFNMALLVTSLYAIVADPLNWRTRFAGGWDHGRALFVPPFFLVSAFALMAGFRLWRLLSGTEPVYTITKLIEWAELCYAAAVLYFLWLGYQELHSRKRRNLASPDEAAVAT